MKVVITPSPTGEDVMLKVGYGNNVHNMLLTLPELHQLDWAIRKYLEGQPFRVAKEATGGRK